MRIAVSIRAFRQCLETLICFRMVLSQYFPVLRIGKCCSGNGFLVLTVIEIRIGKIIQCEQCVRIIFTDCLQIQIICLQQVCQFFVILSALAGIDTGILKRDDRCLFLFTEQFLPLFVYLYRIIQCFPVISALVCINRDVIQDTQRNRAVFAKDLFKCTVGIFEKLQCLFIFTDFG